MDHTFHGRRSCMARHTVRHRAYPVVPNWSPSPDPVAPGGRVLVERPVPDADIGGLHLRDEVLHRPHDEGAPEQGRGIASKGSSTEPRPPPDPGPETGRDRARRALTSHRLYNRSIRTGPHHQPHAPCPMRPGLHRRRPWRCRRQRERRRRRTVADESAQTGQPQRSATLPAPPGRRSAHDPLQHDSNQFGLRFASRFRQIRRRGLPVPQLGGPYVAVDH